MKKTVAISLGIFAIIVTAVLTAGLITYQNSKSATGTGSGTSVLGNGTSTGSVGTVSLDASLVAKHAVQADCWMTINDKVYNITAYFGKHPGGDRRLLNYCGKDATAAFEGQGHSAFAHQLLGEFLVGAIGSPTAAAADTTTNTTTKTQPTTPASQTKPPVTTTTLDSSVVATHATQADCWMTINDKVYNITAYFGRHPGGDRRLLAYCGKDATAAFEGQGHSAYAHQLLGDFLVGGIGAAVPSGASSGASSQTTTNLKTATQTATQPSASNDEGDD